MDKINITITNVIVDTTNEHAKVKLFFKEEIDGYEKKERGSNEFVAAKVKDVLLYRSALTRELCDCSPEFAMFRGCSEGALGQKQFYRTLLGATLTIVREHRKAGDVVPDRTDDDGNAVTYDRDCYTTQVVGVKLTDAAIKAIDKFCEL